MKTFKTYLQEQLQNKEFKEEWDKLESWRKLQRTLIEKRKEKKITQAQIADDLKVTSSNIAKFETSLENPTLQSIIEYAKSIGLKKITIEL